MFVEVAVILCSWAARLDAIFFRGSDWLVERLFVFGVEDDVFFFLSRSVVRACQDFTTYKFELRHQRSLVVHHFPSKIQSQPQPEELRELAQANNSLDQES